MEITYGLDRIALALQGVDSVWEIDFGAGTVYGDLLLRQEIEHCRYYFDEADVDALKNVYDIYEEEAKRSLEAGLVAPAHDFNLKCSFLFNVMDTRGAIGVTERASYFRRMRSVARQIAEGYLEQRQQLEYPFMDNELWQVAAGEPVGQLRASSVSDEPQTFVLEIGGEELPAGDLSSAIRQLKVLAPKMLDELRLSFERLEVRGTPRRLAVIVHKLAGRQTDIETEVQGPPADRAFDPAGEPTSAAVGFARSKGVSVSDLKIVGEDGRRYVAAVVREAGRPSVEVLANALPDLLAALKFEKNMRWNESNVAFSRPLRWLVAMHGPALVPFTFAGVSSGAVSRGLRINGSPEIEINEAANYAAIMAENCVVIQTEERKAVIVTAAGNLAEEVGGAIREDQELLSEVANLIEQPTPLRGRFDERFLELPVDVLAAVMKKHQRYFPVYSLDGESLLPYFITVRNGDAQHLDIVRQGNEHVIGARFADAEFFYRRDTRQSLADFLPRLDTLTFQSDLGSMLDKVKRLEQLAPTVAEMLGLSPEETEATTRAAGLSKADLATSMVVEMTSLQGVMGGHYARLSGESEEVAAAIAEQYEAVSRTRPGLALALSDRLDSLAGLFAQGLAPTGSNDPFALRRAAIQIVENLIASGVDFDLREALSAASAQLPVGAPAETVDEVLAFIGSRLETHLQEQGIRTSVVRAVLAEQGHNPHAAYRAAGELQKIVELETWPPLLDAYARSVRISRDQPRFELDGALLALREEKELAAGYDAAAQSLDGSISSLAAALAELQPVITRFFDEVLVMDENERVRQNRLALLQRISDLPQGIADLSQLEGF